MTWIGCDIETKVPIWSARDKHSERRSGEYRQPPAPPPRAWNDQPLPRETSVLWFPARPLRTFATDCQGGHGGSVGGSPAWDPRVSKGGRDQDHPFRCHR